ncbi:hypothetical protein BC832DRAFT_458686 [Gaertneriomyces semiglobifer]|nr:hypothetical protein BC832DRAFT_458686 [Gaertneriomyces semiglobifer]
MSAQVADRYSLNQRERLGAFRFNGRPPPRLGLYQERTDIAPRSTDYDRDVIPRAIYNDALEEQHMFGQRIGLDYVHHLRKAMSGKPVISGFRHGGRDEADLRKVTKSMPELSGPDPPPSDDSLDSRTVILTDESIEILSPQYAEQVPRIFKPTPSIPSPIDRPVYNPSRHKALPPVFKRPVRFGTWVNVRGVFPQIVVDNAENEAELWKAREQAVIDTFVLRYMKAPPKRKRKREEPVAAVPSGRGTQGLAKLEPVAEVPLHVTDTMHTIGEETLASQAETTATDIQLSTQISSVMLESNLESKSELPLSDTHDARIVPVEDIVVSADKSVALEERSTDVLEHAVDATLSRSVESVATDSEDEREWLRKEKERLYATWGREESQPVIPSKEVVEVTADVAITGPALVEIPAAKVELPPLSLPASRAVNVEPARKPSVGTKSPSVTAANAISQLRSRKDSTASRRDAAGLMLESTQTQAAQASVLVNSSPSVPMPDEGASGQPGLTTVQSSHEVGHDVHVEPRASMAFSDRSVSPTGSVKSFAPSVKSNMSRLSRLSKFSTAKSVKSLFKKGLGSDETPEERAERKEQKRLAKEHKEREKAEAEREKKEKQLRKKEEKQMKVQEKKEQKIAKKLEKRQSKLVLEASNSARPIVELVKEETGDNLDALTEEERRDRERDEERRKRKELRLQEEQEKARQELAKREEEERLARAALEEQAAAEERERQEAASKQREKDAAVEVARQQAAEESRRREAAAQLAIADKLAAEELRQRELADQEAAKQELAREQSAAEQRKRELAEQEATKEEMARQKAAEEQRRRELAAQELALQKEASELRQRELAEQAAAKQEVSRQKAAEEQRQSELAQQAAAEQELVRQKTAEEQRKRELAEREKAEQELARHQAIEEQRKREAAAAAQEAARRIEDEERLRREAELKLARLKAAEQQQQQEAAAVEQARQREIANQREREAAVESVDSVGTGVEVSKPEAEAIAGAPAIEDPGLLNELEEQARKDRERDEQRRLRKLQKQVAERPVEPAVPTPAVPITITADAGPEVVSAKVPGSKFLNARDLQTVNGVVPVALPPANGAETINSKAGDAGDAVAVTVENAEMKEQSANRKSVASLASLFGGKSKDKDKAVGSRPSLASRSDPTPSSVIGEETKLVANVIYNGVKTGVKVQGTELHCSDTKCTLISLTFVDPYAVVIGSSIARKNDFAVDLRRVVSVVAHGSEAVVHVCMPRKGNKGGSKFKKLTFQFDSKQSAIDWSEGLMNLVYKELPPESSSKGVLMLIDKFEGKDTIKLVEKYMKPLWETISKPCEVKAVQFNEFSVSNVLSTLDFKKLGHIVCVNNVDFTPRLQQVLVRNGYVENPILISLEADPVDAALGILKCKSH